MIAKVIELLFYILTVMACVGLLFLALQSRKKALFVFLLIVFCFTWRISIKSISSRYFSSLILFCTFISSIAVDKISRQFKKKHIYTLALLCCLLLFAHSIKTFISFNNIYIKDVSDFFEKINREKTDSIIISNKMERFAYKSDGIIYYSEFSDPLNNIMDVNDVTRALSINSGCTYLYHHPNMDEPDDKYLMYKKILCFNINKRQTRKVFIGWKENQPDRKEKREYSQNLINNGDMEVLAKEETIRKTFKKWIDSGIEYYASPGLKLPQYQYLTTNWEDFSPADYPVFSITDRSIQGKYSLYAEFARTQISYLYFLSRVPKRQGTLRFTIRFLRKNGPLHLRKSDYDKNGKPIHDPKRLCFFVIPSEHSSTPQTFHIDFSVSDFYGEYMIFCLLGKDCSFIIDDIQYCPYSSALEST